MGKDRDKQRTKGNVKPSSSGRAAALVTRDGTLGFVGFGGQGASNLGYVPLTTSPGDDVDASVDADFRLVMRKLTKRDAVTKLKAVQEFCELCKTSSLESVEGVLPYWPRLFNKLAVDIDHRVREATQQAMEQLVARVGRNLAPHLKSVISIWLCAQFDTYAPVASAALRSFGAAFTGQKQTNAVVFCHEVLCEFVKDNLLNQTPSTLSDPKFVAEEDRESKYNRMVTSSLHVLGRLISTCSNDTNVELQQRYLDIMETKKFWKFSKHKSPHIRAAMFSLISTCCTSLSTLMVALSAHVCPVVLTSLDESDPLVCRHMWEAILSVLQSIPDCWELVNVHKAVLPKLWLLLKNGGNGCAVVIYPSLLPFISKVPEQVMGDAFCREFFPSMLIGLHSERVTSSHAESAVVMATYMECLKYCVTRSKEQENGGSSLREYLISEQLLPLVKESLEPGTKISNDHLYYGLADFLTYLSITQVSMETAHDGDQHVSTFSDAREWFWEGFESMCMELVEKPEHDKVKAAVFDSLANCLKNLKAPTAPSKKQKKQRVVFMDSASSHNTTNEPSINGSANNDRIASYMNSDVENLHSGKLVNIVCKISKRCMSELQKDTRSNEHLRLLSLLLPEFICTELLKVLLGKETLQEQVEMKLLCGAFIESVILPWLRRSGQQVELEHAVALFYGVLRTYTENEQVESLVQLIEINDSVLLLSTLFKKGITGRIAGVFTWLGSEQGHNEIVTVLRRGTQSGGSQVTPEEHHGIWEITQLCLGRNGQGPLVNNHCLECILELLAQTFVTSRDYGVTLETLGNYFASCEANPDYYSDASEDVLLALFKQQLNDPIHYSTAADEIWNSGLRAASARRCPSLGRLFVNAASLLLSMVDKVPVEGFSALTDIAVKLLREIGCLAETNETLKTTVKKTFSSFVADHMNREHCKNTSSSVRGWYAIAMLYNHLPITAPIPQEYRASDDVQKNSKSVVFASLLIWKIMTGADWIADAGSIIDTPVHNGILLEAMWLQCWCSCVLGCKDLNNKDSCPSISTNTFPTIFSLFSLLLPLAENLLRLPTYAADINNLYACAVERSLVEGDIWAMVVSRLVCHMKARDLGAYDVNHALQLTVSQSLTQGYSSSERHGDQGPSSVMTTGRVVSMTTSESQSVTSLIPYVDDIYTVKVAVETVTKWISEDKDTEGYAHALSIMESSLSRWSVLANGNSVVADANDLRKTELQAQVVTGNIEESASLIEYQLTLLEALDSLLEWKTKHDRMLLLNVDMDDVTSAELTVNMAYMRIIELSVRQIPDKMKAEHWDLTLCCLAAWLQTCEDSLTSMTSSLLSTSLCYQTCRLHSSVASFFDNNNEKLQAVQSSPGEGTQLETPPEQGEGSAEIAPAAWRDETTGYPPNLLSEWKEFFSDSVFNSVMKIFLYIADNTSHNAIDVPLGCLMEELGRAVVHTPVGILQEYKYNAHAHPLDDALPPWAQEMFHRCLAFLDHDVPTVQIAAYHLLSKVMPTLAACYDSKSATEEQAEQSRSPPVQLVTSLEKSMSHMDTMLQDAKVRFGEHLSLTGDTEAQTTGLTVILTSKLIITFFHNTTAEQRVEHAHYLRKSKLIDHILSMLFRVMPLDRTTAVSDEFELACDDEVTESSIQDLARSLYFSLVHCMPAMVRQWFNGLDKKQTTIVDKYTSASVTQLLCQREMQQVQNSSSKFDNMSVKTRLCAGEVAAVYTVDEISMELVVKLANNHPLGVVTVESGKKVGVTTAQWRSWMLQMTTFLTHQNGSIMDGLILWKRNADKHFEGVEDCMICFSVIHMSNYSLPKLSCRTCKKKFHSICLYRWFNTSNNSTCPLCRNIF